MYYFAFKKTVGWTLKLLGCAFAGGIIALKLVGGDTAIGLIAAFLGALGGIWLFYYLTKE